MALLDKYRVGVDGPWSDREAAHLLRRAGFGGPPEVRAALVGNGSQAAFEAAVDSLVNVVPDDPWLDRPPGMTAGSYGDPLADLPTDDSDLGKLRRAEDLIGLIAHWLYRMRYSAQPLQEKMTLFYHDHFVSEWSKIRPKISPDVVLGNDGSIPGQPCTGGSLGFDPSRADKMAAAGMLAQNYLFRRDGFDGFSELVLKVTRDPAMLVYLDNVENRAGRAQENYARELMELFTMGEGNYSENDVREIAKCLTGETIPNYSCASNYDASWGFSPAMHEPGTKTVFGTTIAADFSGQETVQVLNLIMTRVSQHPQVSTLPAPYNTLPATAVYMSWKLLTWFVNHDLALHTPGDAVLELAHYMRGSDGLPYPNRRYPYDIRAVLRKIFLSRFFYADENYLAMYKNPAEYVTGILRGLGIADVFTGSFGPAIQMVLMGMILFNPPNVSGWQHGRAWFTSGSVVARCNYAYYITLLFYTGSEGEARMDQLLAQNGGPIPSDTSINELIDYYRDRLLQMDLSAEEENLLVEFLGGMPGANNRQKYYNRTRGLIHLMCSMPIANLK